MRALLIAFLLTVATAWIPSRTDERAMYGNEGPWERNWLPRELAGWPAPYLADSPATSVIQQIGLEDDFRAGPFVASFSFWLLLTLGLRRLARRIAGRGRPTVG